MSFAVCGFVESTIEKEREKGFLFGEGLPKKLKKPKKLVSDAIWARFLITSFP